MDIPKPRFSFAPGLDFEKYIETNERRFDAIIEKLREPVLLIFDVKDNDWKYYMAM